MTSATLGVRPPPEGCLEIPSDPKWCRLRVRLLWVHYTGAADLGSQWRWWISLRGVEWDSGPRQLAFGETLVLGPRGQQIVDVSFLSLCDYTGPDELLIRAEESEGWLRDRGLRLEPLQIPCLSQETTNAILVRVLVSRGTPLGWRRPRKGLAAELLFALAIRTTGCLPSRPD